MEEWFPLRIMYVQASIANYVWSELLFFFFEFFYRDMKPTVKDLLRSNEFAIMEFVQVGH
jgi:hypothetical protein